MPRGSADRMPAIWDLNLGSPHPFNSRRATRSTTPIGCTSASRAAGLTDQLHYTSEDASGNHESRPDHGQVLSYQPPTQARLGVELMF
jgi:hypothetical protein